jgi:hypothetical protein
MREARSADHRGRHYLRGNCRATAKTLRLPRQPGGNDLCKDEAFFFQPLSLVLSELRDMLAFINA